MYNALIFSKPLTLPWTDSKRFVKMSFRAALTYSWQGYAQVVVGFPETHSNFDCFQQERLYNRQKVAFKKAVSAGWNSFSRVIPMSVVCFFGIKNICILKIPILLVSCRLPLCIGPTSWKHCGDGSRYSFHCMHYEKHHASLAKTLHY